MAIRNLSNLRAPKKANENKKRVGRGMGSGMGKTSTRGHKGQGSRSGSSLMRGFEGGQMPLHRRLPKRGFRSMDRRKFNEVGIDKLQEAVDLGRLDANKPVDVAALHAAGVVRRELDGVRILGNGALKTKLDLTVHHVTASAKAAIEKAGGKINLIVAKVLPDDEKKRAKTAAKRAKAPGGAKKAASED